MANLLHSFRGTLVAIPVEPGIIAKYGVAMEA